MKIYCILFDTCPQDKRIQDTLKNKGLHYSNYITNGFTTTSLVSLFSGKTPSEMYKYGISYHGTYKYQVDNQEKWNKNIIFNHLPNDWIVHLHGDKDNYEFVTEECCTINRTTIKYIHKPNIDDEQKFLTKMQELSSDENHFIFIKYNEMHDTPHYGVGYENSIKSFIDIINSIDFTERNSLFWLFSDHGFPCGPPEIFLPPPTWLTWVSVTDNITKKRTTKDMIYVLDFFNTVKNRIYNTFTNDDVLADTPDRTYVIEDARVDIDPYKSTVVSAITRQDKNRYIQLSHFNKSHETRTIEYDNTNKTIRIIKDDETLLSYLKNGIWKWYFND